MCPFDLMQDANDIHEVVYRLGERIIREQADAYKEHGNVESDFVSPVATMLAGLESFLYENEIGHEQDIFETADALRMFARELFVDLELAGGNGMDVDEEMIRECEDLFDYLYENGGYPEEQ